MFDDLNETIRWVAHYLRSLMQVNDHGWVPFAKLARRLTGSEEFLPKVQGLAELPQFAELFSIHGNVIRLSSAGLQFAATEGVPVMGPTSSIGRTVRDYAAGLGYDVLLAKKIVARIPTRQGKIVHAFEVESVDQFLTSDTPVGYWSQAAGSRAFGKIVALDSEAGHIFVAFPTEILDAELPGMLRIDRGYLLSQLAERFEAMTEIPTLSGPLFQRHVEGDSPFHINSVELASQLAAVEEPWTRLLWGPPGSGKTFALGYLVGRVLGGSPTARVLIVAPSNKAVDVAFERVARHLEKNVPALVQERNLFRYGYPRHSTILERSEWLGPANLQVLVAQVRQCALKLKDTEQKDHTTEEIAVARAELLASQEALKEAVATHARTARVVATTTAQAYTAGSPIAGGEWDTVIVDEVTMVPKAVCTFLGSLAKSRFLLAGDPQQLGPVFESNNHNGDQFEWMGKDIFDGADLIQHQNGVRQVRTTDSRLARITEQRRCRPALWSWVASLYPGVETANGHIGRNQWLLDLSPKNNEALLVLDTPPLPMCEKQNHSWKNALSAKVALQLAQTAVAEANRDISVAIITPYRAQVRLLREWLKEEQRATVGVTGRNAQIEIGTVHQFQGSEADFVIFDLVDGPGRAHLGLLLQGGPGIRLVNVALTRSRGKVIVIANREWCRHAVHEHNNRLLYSILVSDRPAQIVKVELPPQEKERPEDDPPESPIEELLLGAMRSRSAIAHVRSQYRIRNERRSIVSRADFAFPDSRLAVYCDGRQWHVVEDRWQLDLRQRNELASLGWVCLVYSGRDINVNAAECAAQIEGTYLQRRNLIS